ncbi:nucleotidyltransferase family protein [Gulosibacter molinativorax]|nr:nucleotidyltransferase domain-containing protein [Gulosibacter molinativorax]
MSTPTTTPREVLRAHRNEMIGVLKEFGVRKAGLFGSTARGTDRQGSDIDLIVEFAATSSRDLVGLSLALSELAGISVDVVDADQVIERFKKTGIGSSILQDTVPF